EELRQVLTDIELANGFANRFLWVYVRRARLLPEGGALSDDELGELARRLRAVLQAAAAPRVLRRDPAATARWREVYPLLSQEQPGLGGAITARAEAHVVRLALLYALLDASAVIGAAHLEAALSAWEYVACSARYIFAGETAGDPLAERLLAALRAVAAGLTRSEISSALGHHQSKEAIDGALARLNERGLAHRQIDETRGRPVHRWLAAPAHALFSPDTGCAVP
ncbi:MAG: hypothetical protein HYV63_06130, partial [Candidatus Schekmanbacteria bacterium]|nr:hypothetical protein [Candidatus Schekmanbacteria bacterium]